MTLQDDAQWFWNSTLLLCKTVFILGSDKSVSIPDMLSILLKPKNFYALMIARSELIKYSNRILAAFNNNNCVYNVDMFGGSKN